MLRINRNKPKSRGRVSQEWRQVRAASGCLLPRRGLGPKGQESIAQGLPWETRSKVMGPEGAPAFREGCVGASSAGALSGPHAINPKPRVNPGLSYPGPSGQRRDSAPHPVFPMSKRQPWHFVPGLLSACPTGTKATKIKTVRVPSSDLTMRLEGGEIYLFAGICWYAYVFHRLK
jgi:hypothetical protein